MLQRSQTISSSKGAELPHTPQGSRSSVPTRKEECRKPSQHDKTGPLHMRAGQIHLRMALLNSKLGVCFRHTAQIPSRGIGRGTPGCMIGTPDRSQWMPMEYSGHGGDTGQAKKRILPGQDRTGTGHRKEKDQKLLRPSPPRTQARILRYGTRARARASRATEPEPEPDPAVGTHTGWA